MNLKKVIKDKVKSTLDDIGVEVQFPGFGIQSKTFINLKPVGEIYGKALLALIIEPFLLSEDQKISSKHTNEQESLEIANVFLELGFEVDIISKLRQKFKPEKEYMFYVNHRTNFETHSASLNKDCIKIVHLDVSHWLFSNYAALKRTYELRERRKIAISSFRHITENKAIELCDYATMLGNDYTMGTYRYASKKIYHTSLPTYTTYDWPEGKDFEACKNRFLWFGSSGFVHKGLDLVLEIFSRSPHLHLTVCGPIDEDAEFRNTFHKELYDTPNITTLGWVDVASPRFVDIANNHVAIVFPSCAEGSNGGVITCMQAGLIPIVSVQSGVDVDPSYGLVLGKSDMEEIESKLAAVANLDAGTLKEMAHKAWSYARENNTITAFHEDYKRAIIDIVEQENARREKKIRYNADSGS
ncbi:MAG: glycosyltransferase family 1 protein [Cyclonatronaceae bacterium]